MRIRLFGGVSAVTDGGEQVGVGSAKSQAVLAALALSPGFAVPVSRLVDLVWGDEPPQTAEKALQWHIAQLRKGLGIDAIVRTGAAYRLDVERDAVDVARFQRHLDAGNIDAALLEWTGTPLAGLDAPGLTATVDGLVERWLGAVEADLRHRADTDPQAAIGPLTELVARHPFREGLWALLMTALYRVGRQRDALTAYRKARQQLVEHLGVEPGPQLRELESQILGHDERLGVPPIRMKGNLPHLMDRLISREEELKAIAVALGRSQVVTLVGPGGIGKTRLALAAARMAWLVELAELSSSDDVPRAVADALGITEHQGRTLTQSIVSVLQARPALLLVIDNCEHVIDGAARIVRTIAESCPSVRILATSRERLGLAGEELFAVGPLDPAGPGVELFHARAAAVDPAFELDAYRHDVAEICRRLDGIPLAIELAAARARSLPPPDLVARLDNSLRLVTGGSRTNAQRHQTLQATFQWSYDLLAPPEQALFQQLSIFAGSFDLAAAENVAEDINVDILLGALVDQSMLVVESGPFGRRFRLLETMRQFASEHLRRCGSTDALAQRHADWCLNQVTRIHRLLIGPAEIEGVVRLGELWPNLRSAVDWACANGDPALGHELIRPIATEIALRGRHEIADWAERILATTPLPDEEMHVFWLVWTAERYQQNGNHDGYKRLAHRHGEPDHALARFARAYLAGEGEALRQCLPEAVAQLNRQGDDHVAAFIQAMSAGPLLSIGRFDEVDDTISALADRYRQLGPPTLLNWTLQTLGYSASFQGMQERADQLFDESSSVDVPAHTLSANKLLEARTAFRKGQRSRAFEIMRAYIDELLETSNLVAASVVSIDFINMMATIDRLGEAAHMLAYLESANEFGALASKTLVAEAARELTADATRGHQLDDRQALVYMRGVLDNV